jgi:uncharacterized membrane protein
VRRLSLLFIILYIVTCLAIPSATAAPSADEPLLRAILFYSLACPACHHVIDETLAPMVHDYGGQLQIVGIDTSQPAGLQLYQATAEHYQIPSERQGVPTLVVGDVVLAGSLEIPEQFPALVEEGLAAGGIGWPDIPELIQAASEAQMTVGSQGLQPAGLKTASPDPVGLALAWVVLAGIAAALGYTAWRFGTARQRLFEAALTHAQTWTIPLLSLVGLGIAAYLAYVEITHVEAICGPIGGCNFVQSSPYARILGIPVAVLGVLHYLAIGVLWVGRRYLVQRWANLTTLGLLGLTIFGTLFSTYLTCLEIFVVRAICTWCLGSAVVTTILMLLIVRPVRSVKGKKA